jgi:penicillin-binding protein 1B
VRPWIRRAGICFAVLLLALLATATLLYQTLSRQIDERLAAGWTPPITRLFATPLELSRGLALDSDELVRWLDDLGYTQRDRARGAGEFDADSRAITLIELAGAKRGRTVRVRFGVDTSGTKRVVGIDVPPAGSIDRLALGAPLLSTLHAGERRKRRDTPLTDIPRRVIQSVLAAEDHRFFDHHGVDAVRIAGAAVTNITGNRRYLVGASTLTQQLIKNTLLGPEQTLSRKVHEQALAILLERRLSKARILELYLNTVYLGQQGSFAIHGVAQGARALFGKDLRNLTLGETATMAGIIQAPQLHAPDRHPDRARSRRNGVLQAMVEQRFLTPDEALAAARAPIRGVADTDDVEAPYFVDLVDNQLEQVLPDRDADRAGLQIVTTLDVHLQRLAETAVRAGLRRVESQLPDAAGEPPQAALIAVEPQTGAIRALVGGGSYRASQFNRADRAHRQPGSIVKPFVYLAALERARRDPAFPFTASSLIDDTPTTFVFEGRTWQPANYGDVYDGPVTARMALSRSRNVAAVKVAERTGFQAVADLWAASSGGATPPAYPSLALGVFEATPLDVAVAYTVLANGGVRVPLTSILRVSDGDTPIDLIVDAPRRVAEADSAFLVTEMLASTLDSGTAVGVRRQGFLADAAGKTGTTDDLRDAWFAGFTPTLLTVVWVGMDDGSPLGLTGAQAALPIWTDFMRSALDGRPSPAFSPPTGITFIDVDPATGLRATTRCPESIREAFRDGTEPDAVCPLH